MGCLFYKGCMPYKCIHSSHKIKTRISLKTRGLIADFMKFQKELLKNVKCLVGSIANGCYFMFLLLKTRIKKDP